MALKIVIALCLYLCLCFDMVKYIFNVCEYTVYIVCVCVCILDTYFYLCETVQTYIERPP